MQTITEPVVYAIAVQADGKILVGADFYWKPNLSQ